MSTQSSVEQGRLPIMLDALGIDTKSYLDFVAWALEQQLTKMLSEVEEIRSAANFFAQPNAMKQFRAILVRRTGRKWSDHDLNYLFDSVKGTLTHHYREPLEYGEYLKLLWTVPLRCAKCGKEPPEVKLHIDHIYPASKGGKTKRLNLQFLCQKCNLEKSDKVEGGNPCLDLL